MEKTVSRRHGAAANITNTSHGQPTRSDPSDLEFVKILSKIPPYDEILHKVSNFAEFCDHVNEYSRYIKGLIWLGVYL